jgi:hypothetical protein
MGNETRSEPQQQTERTDLQTVLDVVNTTAAVVGAVTGVVAVTQNQPSEPPKGKHEA